MVSQEWFPHVAAVAKKCPIMTLEIFSCLASNALALRVLCVLTGHLLAKFLIPSFVVHVLAPFASCSGQSDFLVPLFDQISCLS